MSLNDSKIRNVKPSAKTFNVSDSHGLYLHVKPTDVMPNNKTKTALIRLFDRIRTVVRNGISVPFYAKNREMFLFRTIDGLEQAPISHD
ncbi:Arm DNA-binding domain-containing protein [Pectobacterium polaris]|uniref:Arm DNA-binding domain-containing protein n=1 Tax=Pectobacterium polaris TaxID=2042057 RepID=UPI000A8CEC03|nr:Arm DNA-binding domain-containing protein [Pectobacterium polaris]